jgi:hypothetical protein
MKIKTSELIGTALDWVVAILEFPKGNYGGEATHTHYSGNRGERWIRIPDKQNRTYGLAQYSTNWAQGGPIIEREKVSTVAWYRYGHLIEWSSKIEGSDIKQFGPTPLIAAMRCFIASKQGDEVEIPEELC